MSVIKEFMEARSSSLPSPEQQRQFDAFQDTYQSMKAAGMTQNQEYDLALMGELNNKDKTGITAAHIDNLRFVR